MAQKLCVYPLFENGNKSIKVNMETGAVYNDTDFDSTELPSECTNNISYSQMLIQDAGDVFSPNSDAWTPKMPIDHAMFEAEEKNEPVFYNALAFDHPYYNISSSTPGKDYLNKMHRLATWGTRMSVIVKNCLMMECGKETIGRVLVCMMLAFYQTVCQEVYKYVSGMGNTKVTYIQQREFRTVFAINTNKMGEVWIQ